MGVVYVEIPKPVGDFKTEISPETLEQATLKGASIGASLGSIIPGVGTTVGGGIGAVLGFIGDLFAGKPRVHEIMREILAAGFSSALPQNIEIIGIPNKKILLINGIQLDRTTVRAAIAQIGTNVLAALPAGSDPAIDLERAFSSIAFHDSDESDSYFLMGFKEPDFSAAEVQNNGPMPSRAAGVVGLGLVGLVAALSQ